MKKKERKSLQIYLYDSERREPERKVRKRKIR